MPKPDIIRITLVENAKPLANWTEHRVLIKENDKTFIDYYGKIFRIYERTVIKDKVAFEEYHVAVERKDLPRNHAKRRSK